MNVLVSCLSLYICLKCSLIKSHTAVSSPGSSCSQLTHHLEFYGNLENSLIKIIGIYSDSDFVVKDAQQFDLVFINGINGGIEVWYSLQR